jgi:allene oxide cyclase
MAMKVCLVLVALLVGSTAFVLGSASASTGITVPTSLKVLEHATTDKIVDVGKKGDSTGDIFTFHNPLYDSTDTTKVGMDNGTCSRMSPKSGTWE